MMRKENVIKFVEVEYQPTTSTQAIPPSYVNHSREEVELRNLKPLVISGPLNDARATNAPVKEITKLEGIKEESLGGCEVAEASFV